MNLLAVRATCLSAHPYTPDDGRSGDRRLANLCLSYLLSTCGQGAIDLCHDQYRHSDNMTDAIGALTPLASCDCPERREVLDDFYRRWQGERLVVDKWFSLQAASTLPGIMDELQLLLNHPAFELTNPNRFRSLVAAFSQRNQVRFHDPSGAGYRFLDRSTAAADSGQSAGVGTAAWPAHHLAAVRAGEKCVDATAVGADQGGSRSAAGCL